jgi:copper chaperone CopZ
MSTYAYRIEGMTCDACVKTISERLKNLPEVSSVHVDLKTKKAEITSNRSVSLADVKTALSDLNKYSASFYDDDATSPSFLIKEGEASFLKTYKPLLVVFAYILIFSVSFQLSLEKLSPHLFMNHLMAGFFIGLSFFKFLDLKAFAEAFSNYDPLAKKWPTYGYIYPFIEIGLGFLYVANHALVIANIGTAFVLLITTYGVYRKLQDKSEFQCACLGAGFNLPLSNVTIAENLVMVLMAAAGLLIEFK